MISIMNTIQKYLPIQTEETTVQILGIGEKKAHADLFHHIPFRGDMLTSKHARGTKHIRSNLARGLIGLRGNC